MTGAGTCMRTRISNPTSLALRLGLTLVRQSWSVSCMHVADLLSSGVYSSMRGRDNAAGTMPEKGQGQFRRFQMSHVQAYVMTL